MPVRGQPSMGWVVFVGLGISVAVFLMLPRPTPAPSTVFVPHVPVSAGASGFDEPASVINKIYATWSELAILFDHLEPQNHFPHAHDHDGEEEAEDASEEGGEDG